jgi:capsular polysaccharide biosynthesis protein
MKIIKTSLKSALLCGLLLASVSFFVLVVSQKNFKSNIDILVVQNQEGFSDYFALSKSADYLSGVLLESVYSEKFLEEALNTGKISYISLPSDKNDRLKEWQRMVRVRKNSNVGIINIEIFADDQKQANEISEAVLQVISEKNDLFLGRGQKIEIRLLSGPIVEKNPTVSEIAAASLGGFFLGIMIVFAWFFYRHSSDENQESGFFINENDYRAVLDNQNKPATQNDAYLQSDEYWTRNPEQY